VAHARLLDNHGLATLIADTPVATLHNDGIGFVVHADAAVFLVEGD